MEIGSFFKQKECVFALEVFPPKKQSAVESIYNTIDQLVEIPVDYVSVTYSAGGNGAKEYTAQIASYLKNELGVEALAHLTCVNSPCEEVQEQLETLKQAGIENILALRGDKNPDGSQFHDFLHASDLIREIRQSGNFYIAGACYPEGHPESDTLAEDVENLKVKMDMGAKHFVSQLFFDNGEFYRFLNLARKKGVSVPIEAGVMPVVRPQQIERTIKLSSASLPSDFTKIVSRYGDDPDSFYEAGIEYAILQTRDLIESGADGIHLYAMNNPQVAKRIRDGIADLL